MPISLAIQLRTGCRWSHVGVVLPDGVTVIEARGLKGVVETPLHEFQARYRETEFREIFCVDHAFALKILNKHLGQRYDNKAFLGIGLGLNWDDENASHCAELVARATMLFNPDYLNQLVPRDLWRLSHTLDVRN